jgi:predicted amidohydrolase YtcJ
MRHATLIVTNGNLITLDDRHPRATAMAILDDKIVFVGNDSDALQCTGPQTQQLNLAGRTVTPGFIDSHIHLLWYGMQLLRQVDLVGSVSIDDVLGRLSQRAGRSEGWVQGHGFDQDKLAERRFPTRADLDRVSRDRPILISRICGHATVANSAAIALLDPAERAAGDEESGLYTETASDAFYHRIPPLSESEMEEAGLAACAIALRTGITSVHTLLDTPDQMLAWSRLRRKGKLPIRITAMPPYKSVATLHAHGISTTFGDDWLRVGAAKLFSDGSLGAHTALLAQPYADNPDTRGIRIYDPEDLKRKAADAQAKGFQLAIHAIGDQAVRETIDAIEFALAGESNRYHRHRIEHASVISPDSLERLAKLGIVCTLQPQFVTSDTWTADRLGPARTPWAYPFKSMLNAGVPITLSSDCPVEKLDAFAALSSAVGRDPWSPHETLTPEQAIRAYCLGSAYAGHAEDRVGSLTPGKLADFVVLSADPTHLNAKNIAMLHADDVYVAGTRAERNA